MSLLSRFARSKDPEVSAPEVACTHRDLAPRWDNAADMGKKDKITSYTCAGCQATVSMEDAERPALV